MKKDKCKRCNHTWYRRRPSTPLICPKCKSPYWNRAKTGVEDERELWLDANGVTEEDILIDDDGREFFLDVDDNGEEVKDIIRYVPDEYVL